MSQLEVIEVIETGPQGPKGVQGNQGVVGPSGGELITSKTISGLVISEYDNTIATEYTIPFGASSDNNISITVGGMTLLNNLSSINAIVQLNLELFGGSKDLEMHLWVEASGDGGVSWATLADSLRTYSVNNNNYAHKEINFTLESGLVQGIQMRLRTAKTGNNGTDLLLTPPIDFVTSLGTVAGYSVKAVIEYKI